MSEQLLIMLIVIPVTCAVMAAIAAATWWWAKKFQAKPPVIVAGFWRPKGLLNDARLIPQLRKQQFWVIMATYDIVVLAILAVILFALMSNGGETALLFVGVPFIAAGAAFVVFAVIKAKSAAAEFKRQMLELNITLDTDKAAMRRAYYDGRLALAPIFALAALSFAAMAVDDASKADWLGFAFHVAFVAFMGFTAIRDVAHWRKNK